MKPTNLKQKQFNFIPLGFLLPFIGMTIFMILCGVLPFGTKSLLYSDAYHQYYPFFKEFRRAILNGDSLLYSWNVGLGIDYLGLIAYYLASPLNLISIIVPESLLLHYFTFLTPIRLGLAGLFFSIFLNKVFKKNDLSVPFFGCFYAMCAWALGYQWNVMWLDTFALLPLVALGTYSLLKEKKFFLYTISLFLSVFSNYYIGFFTCIFVLLTFICYQICRWEGFKKFFLDLVRIALFSVLAIGMTAILELPAFAALQTTHSSINEFPTKFQLNIVNATDYKEGIFSNWEDAKAFWEDGSISKAVSAGWKSIRVAALALFNGMKQVAGNSTGGTHINLKESDALPNIYCGVITVLFSFLFLTCKQVKIRDKICTVLFLAFLSVSFLLRQLDYIWHGFHFTNMIPYRFSFIYSFVMLYMAYRAYLLKRSFKPWQIGIAVVLSIILVVISNDFKDTIAKLSADGYWQSFGNTIKNFSFTSAGINRLLQYVEDFFYPVYNFLFIIGTGIILFVGSIRGKFPSEGQEEEKLSYIKRFRKRQRVASILLLCFIGLELIFNLVNYSFYWSGASISDYPKGKSNSEKMFSLMRELEEDTLFYRAETSHSQILNDAALNDYNGVTTFTSSANVSTTKFMKGLGFGSKESYNRYCYESSSPVPNLFLNLKYVIDRDGFYYEGPMIRTNSDTGEKYTSEKPAYANPYFDKVGESSLVALTKNNAYLPLGFLCEESLADFSFEDNHNQFTFEQMLIEAATGNTYTLWHPVNGDQLTVSGDDNVRVTSFDSFGKCRYTADSEGIITYAFTADRSGLFCIDIDQSKRNSFSVWLNNNHDELPDERIYSETYSLPQMLSVCTVEVGDIVEVQFKCESGDTARIEVYGAILDDVAFTDAYNTLAQSTLQLTKFSTTFIEGTIDCHKDGLMYTSIPQNGENWKVYVDGKPTEPTLVGNVMIGVSLTKGTHTITFEYENKAYTLGSIITAVCTAAFVTLWIICYKPYNNLKVFWSRIKAFKIKTLFIQKGKYDK